MVKIKVKTQAVQFYLKVKPESSVGNLKQLIEEIYATNKFGPHRMICEQLADSENTLFTNQLLVGDCIEDGAVVLASLRPSAPKPLQFDMVAAPPSPTEVRGLPSA
eukprot:CAMPEP_0194693776 /NCGR_PEP_ID=MMETSP0295-20121207/20784_1 /TAXON_ID=39354 /ORGANISM="Heterosigma akashiwo, Strain CCMP2393" /LENGTH=105 /DNA_ID=CAMNT_0039584825 /DNA_START=210 /DNA_END=523 /DNA_ORIENTATION=-